MSIIVALTALIVTIAVVFALLWRRERAYVSACGKDIDALNFEIARLAQELDGSKSDCHNLKDAIKSASSLSQAEREEYEDMLLGIDKEIQEKTEDIRSLRERNEHLQSDNRDLKKTAGQWFEYVRTDVHERLEADRNY